MGLSREEYPILSPSPGWAEQAPERWWHATCRAIGRLVATGGVKPQDVTAVGLSGQMHGLVLLDRGGSPLRPAIIWLDRRSEEECGEIEGRIGKEKLYHICGIPAATGFFGPSLLWVRRHRPADYEKAYVAVLPKDYLRFRLTGQLATDATDASGTLLFDITRRSWSREIVDALGLREDLLPPPLEPAEVAGRISGSAADETGLAAGTLVAAGGGDQAMAAVGCGIVVEGVVASTLGTGGQLTTAVSKVVVDLHCRIHTLCHATPDLWLLTGAILSAGLSLRWFHENILATEAVPGGSCGIDPYESLSLEAEKAEPCSRGLVFLPYLSGERTPHMDPRAKGCFVGLNLSHTRAHLVRAMMEGVVFAMKDSLSIFCELGVPVHTILCSGGGARSIRPMGLPSSLEWRQASIETSTRRLRAR